MHFFVLEGLTTILDDPNSGVSFSKSGDGCQTDFVRLWLDQLS